jgi:signal transduction histidine kinase
MNTRTTDPLADRLLQAGTWLWLVAIPIYAWVWPEASRATLLWLGTVHVFVLTWLAIRVYRKQPSRHMGLFVGVWAVYGTSSMLYVLYRVANLPIYVTLVSNFLQGAFVAALLGCAVSVQIVRRRSEMRHQIKLEQDRALLYAAAHHDLWQPLQSIGLYARSFEEADELQRQKLYKGMDAAMTSVGDFMAAWRQLSGKELPPPKITTIDVDEVLAPIVEEYRYWCQSKHVMLRYRPINIRIQCDVQLLQRIVRNLLSNAMRYTESGGRILVGERRRDGHRWLTVIDTGVGMSREQAAQCFEAFRRFGEIDKVPEGMGIGLYSVRQMTQALGLKTSLRSTSGKGTAVGIAFQPAPDTKKIPHVTCSGDAETVAPSHNAVEESRALR